MIGKKSQEEKYDAIATYEYLKANWGFVVQLVLGN
jgi:hypothetical protein